MTKYNIYYNYTKINNKPLNKEDIDIIKNKEYIFKNIDGINQKIPVSKIKFISCTVLL